MRCTQIIGLPEEAKKFLGENMKMNSVLCPHCNGLIKQEKDIGIVYASAADEGMFDDGPELYEYTLQDGSKVREVVQAAPWSSGPCIFLKLVDAEGKDLYTWTEKEINEV